MTDEDHPPAQDAAKPRAEGGETDALYTAGGQGIFVGLIAAGMSHPLQTAALPVMAFAYLFGMSKMRGWKELASLLNMLVVVILYFTAYDVVSAADLGGWATTGVVVGTAVLALVMTFLLTGRVAQAREYALAIPPRGPFGRTRPEPLPAEDVDRWEAGYFARLRTKSVDRGPRRVALPMRPYVWIASMILVALVADSKAVGAVAMSVALFQIVVAGRLTLYAKRLRRPDAAEALLWDARDPVLLLRSFSLDALPAHVLDRKRLGNPLRFFSWMDKRSFEEFLAAEFERVGPVVAIGRPGERVAPLGAAREYVGDDAWQDRVLTRAEAAQCVLMLVDDSPGMAWEIEHVSAGVGLQRLLFVLPPRGSGQDDAVEGKEQSGAGGWDERWAALRKRFAFLPEVRSETGAVLFDDAGQPVLIDAGGSVDERVQAIRTTWERERGLIPRARGADDIRAAQEALETAMLATVSGLGLAVPRERSRGLRRGRAVTAVDLPSAVAELDRRTTEVGAALGPRHPVTGGLHFLSGLLRQQSGDLPGARDEYAAAVDVLEAELGASRPLVAFARAKLGDTLATLGDFNGARGEYEVVLAGISSAVHGEQSAIERVLAFPDMDLVPGSPAEAAVRAGLGRMCQQLGDEAAARAAYEEALPVLDAVAPAARSPEDRVGLGLLHNNYGLSLYSLGDVDAARAQYERSLAILLDVLGDRHVLIAVARSNLGLALKTLGQRDAARAQYERAVAVLDAALGRHDDDVGVANPDIGKPYANLGTLLHEMGEPHAARRQLERAIALTEAVVGPDAARMGTLRCTYGTILAGLGERAAACAELERAVTISERAHGANHQETQLFRANLTAISSP